MKTNNVSPGKSKLGREIAVVIACKLLFIFGLWYFFFSPEHRPEVNADVVGNVVLGAADAPAKAITSGVLNDPI